MSICVGWVCSLSRLYQLYHTVVHARMMPPSYPSSLYKFGDFINSCWGSQFLSLREHNLLSEYIIMWCQKTSQLHAILSVLHARNFKNFKMVSFSSKQLMMHINTLTQKSIIFHTVFQISLYLHFRNPKYK